MSLLSVHLLNSFSECQIVLKILSITLFYLVYSDLMAVLNIHQNDIFCKQNIIFFPLFNILWGGGNLFCPDWKYIKASKKNKKNYSKSQKKWLIIFYDSKINLASSNIYYQSAVSRTKMFLSIMLSTTASIRNHI